MPKLEIVKYPDPLLTQKSLPVEKIDENIKGLVSDMLETMYDEHGIGIAAIQVGVPLRIFIVDIPVKEVVGEEVKITRNPLVFINPEITWTSEEKILLPEGCLSVRGKDGYEFIRQEVLRPISLNIKYTDLNGNVQELSIDGSKSEPDKLFARCAQHEYDHLEGVLFTDYAAPLNQVEGL